MLSKEVLYKLRELFEIQAKITKHSSKIEIYNMPEFNTKKIEIVVYDVIEEKHITYFRIEFKLNKDTAIAILNKAIEVLKKYV